MPLDPDDFDPAQFDPPPDDSGADDPEWVKTLESEFRFDKKTNTRQWSETVYLDEQTVSGTITATQPAAALGVTQTSQGIAAGADVTDQPPPSPATRTQAQAMNYIPSEKDDYLDYLSNGPAGKGKPKGPKIPDKPIPGLREYLSIEAWAQRDIPPPDRLLGDLVTTKTRMFIVGRTGLGKTMLGFCLACGMASGQGFLHWRAVRPVRVLYIDGEMPDELIKARSIDALRRCGTVPKPGNLVIYSRDTEEDFAEMFPDLGPMLPLNTEAGHQWVLAFVAAIGGVDVVIFDNVMSLCEGDQKDEVTWSGALPLVQKLTSMRIGQIWLDHTGHAGDHQYGSSTKSWRADTVGIMSPVKERNGGELAFTLSFEHPGKARRRTPQNWQDFQDVTIRLTDDRWTSEPTDGNAPTQGKALPPGRVKFHDALIAAIARHPAGHNCTTRQAWVDMCTHRDLIDPPPQDGKETSRERGARLSMLRTAKSDLIGAGWIAVEGETVSNLRVSP